MTGIEFRVQCDAPSEPGWYWARETMGLMADPMPVLVFDDFGKLRVICAGNANDYPIPDYDWFGNLIMVKEG